jgi:signal transduction histidine kinase/DNA-binding response OmpR family regulator
MDATIETENPVRILIVDDHPNTATMLARVLSKFDTPVEVFTASSGEDALIKIGDQMADILITDFMMPGLNGLELIEKLKDKQKPFHTILITAYDTPGLAITARRLNVQDYLVKPVQPEKIRSIVSRVIEDIHPSNKDSSAATKRAFKILIADDYPDNLRLLSTRLKSEGYTFIPAWDGEETLRKTREEDPDLILLDVNMPKKDGFQVLAEMRADPDISHIPVIMITAARIGPKDVREGLTLGADDYVIKPFDWRELAARIRSKLRVKEAEDILRKRTKELGILPEIGQELSAGLDIEKLACTIVNRTVEVLGATNARLDLFQPDGSVLCRSRQTQDESSYIIDEPYEQVIQRGLIPEVLESKQGVVVKNIEQDKRWHGTKHNGDVSAVAVPLMGSRDVIGVLTLTHHQVSYFNEDHQTLLLAIASQAAIAIENAQLLDVEHKRVQELMILNLINQEINRFTHSRQLLDSLPRLIQEGFGYPSVAIWNGGSNGINGLKIRSSAGVSQDLDSEMMVTAPYQAAKSRRTVVLSDPEGHISVIAVPMMLEGKVQGVLAVSKSQTNAFCESDYALLETLSTQIAAAMERVGLFESVEQEQRRLLAVLHSAADAILVMDSEMRLTLANPAGENLFPDLDSRVGQALPDDKGYEGLNELLLNVRKENAHQQGEVKWPDGRFFSVLVTPIEEGGQVAVLHDVSQFKALAELKNEYIATATHDLKNPIQAVLGYNDLLIKAGELTPMQQDFSRRIRGSALQMRDLVLNLLEISRLESGMAMNLEILDLHELLEEAVRELRDQALAKGHSLEMEFCEASPQVTGDRGLLMQLARNLLSNAIKYTPEDGHICVATRLDEAAVVIKFQDTGVGIPEDDLPLIWEKFFRVHSNETRDIEGTGLGLAIVKSIVENHRGEINVQSVTGEGSSFEVQLPLQVHA